MIDLQKLKQFPLSFKQFEGYIEKQYSSVLFLYNGSGIIKNEDVILFLDDNNINIQVSVKCALDGSRWYLPYIWVDSDGCDMDEHLPDRITRTIATEDAIAKAFQMLETKLKIN